MGQYDIISKSLIRTLVKDMATYLLDLEIRHLEEVATERQRIETRLADIVMIAESVQGERFILHLELQNSNDLAMPSRMLRYFTDITLAHPQLPVRQYCIYIGKEPLSMADRLDGHDWHYRYQLIDMHRLDCQQFLRQNTPDALVIAVLCDFRGRDEEEILQELVSRLIALTGKQPERLRNYLKMMEILSSNRGLTDIFKTVERKMLREIDIEKLPSFQIGLDRGIEIGVGKGVELGRQEGRLEGRQEGRQEGRTESLWEVAKNAIHRGMDIDEIVLITGLSREQIIALKMQQQ